MSAMNLPPPIHGMNMNMNIPILPHIPQYQNIPYQSHFVSDDGRESSGGGGSGHNGDLNQGITSSSFYQTMVVVIMVIMIKLNKMI